MRKTEKMNIYDRIFRPVQYTLENGKTVSQKRSRLPLILIVLLVSTIIAGEVTGFSLRTLINRISYFFVIRKSI